MFKPFACLFLFYATGVAIGMSPDFPFKNAVPVLVGMAMYLVADFKLRWK